MTTERDTTQRLAASVRLASTLAVSTSRDPTPRVSTPGASTPGASAPEAKPLHPESLHSAIMPRISDERIKQIDEKKAEILKQNIHLRKLRQELALTVSLLDSLSPEDQEAMSRTAVASRTSRNLNDDVLNMSESVEQNQMIIHNIEQKIRNEEVQLVGLEKEKKMLEEAYP